MEEVTPPPEFPMDHPEYACPRLLCPEGQVIELAEAPRAVEQLEKYGHRILVATRTGAIAGRCGSCAVGFHTENETGKMLFLGPAGDQCQDASKLLAADNG
jgi:hypothetical protein